jgi:hypothetical protein
MESATPSPEEPRFDRFRVGVAVLIAIVSILSALVASRASLEAGRAADLDQRGTQEVLQRHQKIAEVEGDITQDLRLLGPYQEHVLSARLLARDAEQARARGFLDLAEELRGRSNEESTLARSLRLRFLAFIPDFGDDEGNVAYELEVAREFREALEEDLRVLNPDETFEAAERAHDRTVQLVGVTTLFIASLFFLTLAQFVRLALRRRFAVAGVGVLAGALVLLGIVVVGA